jgi:hypothetical protein
MQQAGIVNILARNTTSIMSRSIAQSAEEMPFSR